MWRNNTDRTCPLKVTTASSNKGRCDMQHAVKKGQGAHESARCRLNLSAPWPEAHVHILEIIIVHIILYCIFALFLNNCFNHLFNFIPCPIYLFLLPTYLLLYLYLIIALVLFLSIVLLIFKLYCILCIHNYGLFVRNIHTTTTTRV